MEAFGKFPQAVQCSVHSVTGELSSLLDEFAVHNTELEKYREDTIKLGQHALKLYSTDHEMEVDEVCSCNYRQKGPFQKAVFCYARKSHEDSVVL